MQNIMIFGGKRLETVPVKFSESEKNELQRLAQLEDRGVGYIVRELAFRGLAQYLQDGKLKLTEEQEKLIENKRISGKEMQPLEMVQAERGGKVNEDKTKKKKVA